MNESRFTDTHPAEDITVRKWHGEDRWDLYVTGWHKASYTTEAGVKRAAVRELEESTGIRQGMRVQATEPEEPGNPQPMGAVTRIELELEDTGSGEAEITYWITWDGATAPDPHGRYAFAPLPPVRDGWEVVESTATCQFGVCQILRHGNSWSTRRAWNGEDSWVTFCANEQDARESYANAIED